MMRYLDSAGLHTIPEGSGILVRASSASGTVTTVGSLLQELLGAQTSVSANTSHLPIANTERISRQQWD